MTSFKIRAENFNEVQRLLNEINQILFRAQRLRGERLESVASAFAIFSIFSRKYRDKDDVKLQGCVSAKEH